MDDTERRWVLMEQMASDMQAIKEQVSLVPEIRGDLAAVKANVADLKSQMIVVTNVVTEHSKNLKELKAGVRGLDIRVSEVGSDVQTIKTRLTLIEGDLKEVKGYVGTHHETLVELQTASHTH